MVLGVQRASTAAVAASVGAFPLTTCATSPSTSPRSRRTLARACKAGSVMTARGFTERLGDAVAVDALSFGGLPGRVTGVLGPTRSGQSRSIRMVVGLDSPTVGTVIVTSRHHPEPSRSLRDVAGLLEADQ